MLTMFYLIQNAGKSMTFSMHHSHSQIGRTIPTHRPLSFHNLLQCLVAQEPPRDKDDQMLRAFLLMSLRRLVRKYFSGVILGTDDVTHNSYYSRRLSGMHLGGVILEPSVVAVLA